MLNKSLENNHAKHLHRTRRMIEKRNATISIIKGKSHLDFCSTDYLNIATHAHIKKVFAKSAMQYGLGSTGSALISGYTQAHAELEAAFAEFLQRDRAILFNSGYHANMGVITALTDRQSIILLDKYCHASLNDGVRLARTKYYRYRHHDLAHAEELINQQSKTQTLLITESVFSMQGSMSDLHTLSALASKHQATVIIDDAHGIGVLGKHGAGITEHAQLSQQDIPCLVTPLSKAFGSVGSIVSGSKEMIESLLQFAGTYRYSTSLPPAICDATLAALHLIKNESWRREKLYSLCRFFIEECRARNLFLASEDFTPIKAILIPSSQHALIIQNELSKQGLLVNCIRPSTVPAHLTCLRISLSCMHEEQQIIYLLDHIQKQYAQLFDQKSVQ